jgi:hypothetical protein
VTDSDETVDTSQIADAPQATIDYSSTYAEPADRPELLVAGAFAGGLVLAVILKRLAR